MGVVTVRPSATVQQGAYTTIVGGGTAHGNLADGTEAGTADATAIDITASGYDATRGLILDLPAFSVPANARITGVRIRFRARDNSGYPFDSLLRARPRLLDASGSYYVEGVGVYSNYGATAMTYYVGAYETATPQGLEWTAADLVNLQVLVTASTQFFGSGGRVAEVWVDVQYNEKPTIVTTSPAESAVLGTMFPTLGYTYSDADGDPLDAVWIKFFNAATYGAGGFNPETASPVAQSGWVGSSNPGAWMSTVALPNDTYRGYAKARHAFAGGYFETDWDFQQFSVSVTPPPVPSLAAVADTTLSKVTLTVTSGGGSPTTEGYDFEFLNELGVWTAMRPPSVVGAGTQVNTDWEAPPQTARSYRARAYRTSGGFRINSAWSGTASATLTVLRTRLLDPVALTAGIVVRLEGDTLGHESEEQTQVLYPLGRRNPVVLSGTIQGEVYNLTFVFPDEASYQAFEALRNTQRVLLLKSARNWQRYIKFVGSRAVTQDRTTADIAPYWYTVTIQAVEQDRP